MGPWFHGGWVRSDGSKLGDISFAAKTGEYYIENIELPCHGAYSKQLVSAFHQEPAKVCRHL
jgi:hypothetical protein